MDNEKRKLRNKKYYEKTKDKRNVEYQENKEIIIEKNKEYRELNKDKIKEQKKEYRQRKKTELNNYQKIRRQTNPLFRLSQNIRERVRDSFKTKGKIKRSKTELILGCSFEEFKQHIESKFELWMNWDNYGLYNGELNYGWDIDHIIPLKIAITEDDVIKLNHYTNLQPLCSKINRDIKKDRV